MMRVSEFWKFMREREAIRLRRLAGAPMIEWTEDKIFRDYSFTNCKRAHDRVTTLLWREYYSTIHARHQETPAEESLDLCKTTLLNAAIFRFHGTVETALAIGWTPTWTPEAKQRMIHVNAIRMARGDTVFTGAYIVPACGSTDPKYQIVAEIVSGIWNKSENILDTTSWAEACYRMCGLWGVGEFMAKEVLLDYILATGWVPDDWETWTPVGPGARKGASVVKYDEIERISESEALEVIREVYAGRHEHWPDDYVALDLTDIQFQFCEYAKYRKAETGVGRPKSRFRPTVDDVTKAP